MFGWNVGHLFKIQLLFLVQFHLNQQRWTRMLFMAQLLESSLWFSLSSSFSWPGNDTNVSRINYFIQLVNVLIRDASNWDLWFVNDWQREIQLRNSMETERGKEGKQLGVGQLAVLPTHFAKSFNSWPN